MGNLNKPQRHGVGASTVFLPLGAWPNLLVFLQQRFPGYDWCSRMRSGAVLDVHGRVLGPDTAYQPQTRVFYYREVEQELVIPLQETVLHQDQHLVVADKPPFLPVVPAGRYVRETLLARLRHRLQLVDLVPIHRIDRDTSGLVLFSVNPASRNAYAALFRERAIEKVYEAIAPWRSDLPLPLTHRSRLVEGDNFMCAREVAGEPNTETAIALMEQRGPWARYSLSPRTGHRHQLRVHMAALGMPIVNDNIYPVLTPELPLGTLPDLSQPLQLLAKQLRFIDPITQQMRDFESPQQLQAWPI